MQPVNELLAEFESEDGFDVVGATKKMDEVLREVRQPLGQGDLVALEFGFLNWAVSYVADLLITVADEAGVLPNGPEVERDNLAAAFTFDRVRRAYELVHRGRQPKLEVPGQLPLDLK